MNAILWQKIFEFDLDEPIRGYGFSTRLANENSWTSNFTKQAILEYKKFMYLAAIQDQMVSPSDIVDIVWHQHLIFTQSYHRFCEILEKKIEHIPGTHDRQDLEKLKLARYRLSTLYIQSFGPQPAQYWHYQDIYEPLSLDKSPLKINTFLALGFLGMAIVYLAIAPLLKPMYIKIDNPEFLIGFITIACIFFVCLELYNRRRLNEFLRKADKGTFLFNLSPAELIYLQNGKLEYVIHGYISRMIEKNILYLGEDKILCNRSNAEVNNEIEFTITQVIETYGANHYPSLLPRLLERPVFRIIENSMASFKRHFINSRYFSSIFYANFSAISCVFLFGLVRLSAGIQRDKPIAFLVMLLAIYLFCSAVFLVRLGSKLGTETIPQFYKTELNPSEHSEWEWKYFFMGQAALIGPLIPILTAMQKSSNTYFGTGDSSCSSGCGSSCGGGCGGCGGGD